VSPNLGDLRDRRGRNQSELAISLEGEETNGDMFKECRLWKMHKGQGQSSAAVTGLE